MYHAYFERDTQRMQKRTQQTAKFRCSLHPFLSAREFDKFAETERTRIECCGDVQTRIQERRTGRTPPPPTPPKISKDYRVFVIYIYTYTYIRTDILVNSYVTIIYLPLNSDFISIIQTLIGSADI